MNQIKNESKSILFVDSSVSLKEIIDVTNTVKNIQIFTFDYVSHKLLIQHNISHIISDNYISEDDLDLIQNQSYKFAEWYKLDEIKNYQTFEDIDLGSLFKIEFYVFLLPFLKKIIEIKNIIHSNQDYRIYATNQLYDISKYFGKNLKLINNKQLSQISKYFGKNLKLINNKQLSQIDFFYDTISFETNFFNV